MSKRVFLNSLEFGTHGTEHYGERGAVCGGLGHFEAMYLMPLAMAHAGKLGKFGA